MKQINLNEIRSFLQKLGLKIENWLRLSNFLSIFTFDRLLKDYCILFLDSKTDRFIADTTDNDLVNLILFDKKISSNLLKWVLLFESKFKKVMIEKWVNFVNLKNDKIYLLPENEFEKLIPNIKKCNDLNLSKFRYSLFEYVSNSEFLVEYESLDEIPIHDLSYSWSFATAINFYRVIDDKLKIEILKEFNIPDEFTDVFHKVLNVLLKVRNTISHNHIIYNFKSNLYRVEFNKLYKSIFREESNIVKPINLHQIIYLVDYLLNWNQCKKEFDLELKELKINFRGKENLIKILFGIEF